MGTDQFQSLAQEALNTLPEPFLLAMENVVIVVEDYADSEVLRKMQLSSAYDLLGLYEGVPLTVRESGAAGSLPEMIRLYREPILSMCRQTGECIGDCIADVLIHEIGHHFGFSDAEMEAIESDRVEARG